jgi:hypothetical protein
VLQIQAAIAHDLVRFPESRVVGVGFDPFEGEIGVATPEYRVPVKYAGLNSRIFQDLTPLCHRCGDS